MSNRQPRSEPWAFWIVVAIALLAMFALNGCATKPFTLFDFGVEKEMAVEDLSSYDYGYYQYRYKIVKARCVATVKAKYPWSCYYDGKWYWLKDGGVGMLQNDRTGYY